MNHTYKERVKTIAEEMRATVTPEKGISAGQYMYARIAVAHTAEAVSVALSRWGCEEDVIETYLKDQGLIPEKEVSNDI